MITDDVLRKILKNNSGDLSHKISFFHADGSVKSTREIFDEIADTMKDEYGDKKKLH